MTKSRIGKVVGIDVGGTFTDLLQLDAETGAVRVAKVPTTSENQAVGVMNALREAKTDLGLTDLIVHGTTTTTNAVLERKLSRAGLLTTKGFRDVLELGRRTRPQPYGMTGHFIPIIPRDLRLEVTERMDAAGHVLTELDEDTVRAAGEKLIAAGCEAVVVHFLHSYANPVHERRAREILAGIWPNTHITLGHEVLQEAREYERGVTAAVNASVQPILDRYLQRLTAELDQGGYRQDVLVMAGNGGMVSARLVAREAAKTVMSGPASGVMAAAYTGQRAGIENLLTYDMGGTSTDVALIKEASPVVSNEIEIEYAMPIHVPMVDVRTVGAGGGSIAWVNAAGLLNVGPESAGAVPGPICYGRGGKRPTISDANLILGRLDPSELPQTSAVNRRDIEKIFDEELGQTLGLNATETAQAVIRMANTKMAGAIRMVSLSLGEDPRDFALFAFGGAGPLHACALARELSVPRVLVPARPGITNAIGCVVADLRHDFVQAVNIPLNQLRGETLADVFKAQAAQGAALLAKEKTAFIETQCLYSVDMQYSGQTHVLRVPLENPEISAKALREKFETVYFQRFKIRLPEVSAQIVTANCSVIGVRPPLDLSTLIDPAERKATLLEAQKGERAVCFEFGWQDTPVFTRAHLPIDFSLTGPAVIEQMDTTVLIEPGCQAHGDAFGNIHIEIGGQ